MEHDLVVLNTMLNDFPHIKMKLIKKILYKTIYFGTFNSIQDTLEVISKNKTIKKMYNTTIYCNPTKRRTIIWHIIQKEIAINHLSFEKINELLLNSMSLWDILFMYENVAEDFMYNPSYYNGHMQIIQDRTKYIDIKALKLIYLGISLFNKLRHRKDPVSYQASNIINKTICSLCYYNITCLLEENKLRTKQLSKNYVLLSYYKDDINNEEIKDMIQNINNENKYLLERHLFLEQIDIYFINPLITDYICDNIYTETSYHFYKVLISYLDNWSITLPHEQKIGALINTLIKNPDYTETIIIKLNSLKLNPFYNYVKDSQSAIQHFMIHKNTNAIQIIIFINTYDIDLTGYTPLIYLLLNKITTSKIQSLRTIIEFVEKIYFNQDVLTFKLRNIFLNALFKLLKNKKELNKLNNIIVDICINHKLKLINYFSHEHAEFDNEIWNYFINYFNYTEHIITDIPHKIKQIKYYINFTKGLCLDEITATIIEIPVILPPKIFVDKYTIYPYLLIEKKNPFNRQYLTINELETFNKDNDALKNFKIQHNY